MRKGIMYSVFRSRVGPNFGVQPAADKKFYLRLTVKKIRAFAVFTQKYLRLYSCGDTKFTAAANCEYPKTEIHKGAIEIQNYQNKVIIFLYIIMVLHRHILN